MYLDLKPERHASLQHIAKFFDFDHLDEPMRSFSETMADTAQELLDNLNDSPELTEALRKLLEAKDCVVRAALDMQWAEEEEEEE